MAKRIRNEPQQPSTSQFLDNRVRQYSISHPHKYSPVCRRTLTSKTENLAEERRTKLKTQLSNTEHVSVTVDIWSGRKMRGFIGVTMYWIEKEAERIQLRSNLLACERFKGSHTAERICDQFESICDEYTIKDKLDYIISDNAVNMRKAFTVCFPSEQEDGDDRDNLDPELWCDLTLEDQETVDVAMAKKQRLQCFAHTLQLVVGDCLKETKVISPSLSKLSKLDDAEFGEQKGIPAAVNTRWNSILRQVKAVLQCNHLKLSAVLEKAGHRELSFTAQEWNLLKELLDMKPFGEATDLTQGEKVTISAVVPSVLSLNHHLEKLKPQVCFLCGLVRSLQASLNKRFLGIFINVKMARTQDVVDAPFSNPVYLKAAALDPAFSLLWVELFLHKDFSFTFRVAIRVLAVHGGIILRPHRAQMTDKLLAKLVFCKCNAA
uniref:HAT C-terminal dimerisation domain-containing protein n=1 Tax=Cynoglossus semilaevis TaxID=244447 RepID=A0A3P8VU54_CYNSE